MNLAIPEPIRTNGPPDLAVPLSQATEIDAVAGQFRVSRLQLTEGMSHSVELLVIDTGKVRAAICPTRGMSLWKAHIDGLDVGWKSPVAGPVHPMFVALEEPSGLGWLDGFDELLVRCGLRSFGAPDFDTQGQLLHPLHGRIGNLPARNVYLQLDKAHSLLHLVGEVHETRFLQYNLSLSVKYTFAVGENTIGIADVVTNQSATPTSMQLLYHINVGGPLLGSGATLDVGARRVVARNSHAAGDLAAWKSYLPPTTGYAEQVYFFDSQADSHGWARALLTSPQADRGFSVRYQAETLPYFTQWKNTVAESDGYVTGLEPGTGFPNPRSFEEEKGRVVELQPKEACEFRLELEGIRSATRITQLKKEIALLAEKPIQALDFDPQWCVARV